MDILITLRDFWIDFIWGLPEPLLRYILRMGLLLTLASILLSLTWLLPWRSVISQTFVAFIVISFTVYIPIEKALEFSEGWFVFLITTGLLAMISLANLLPFLLTPRFGNQIKIKKILLIIIWGLFLVQLMIGR